MSSSIDGDNIVGHVRGGSSNESVDSRGEVRVVGDVRRGTMRWIVGSTR